MWKKSLTYRLISNQGSVLILVMWVVSVLVMMVVAMSAQVGGQINYSRNFRNRTRAEWLAQAGIRQALAELNKEKKTSWYDSLRDSWCNNAEVFKSISLGEGSFTVSHQYIEDNDSRITFYGISDEERKLNFNTAGLSIIKKLLEEVGGLDKLESQKVAAAIVDWRDPDGEITEQGAEDYYYQTLKNPYHCKDKKIDVSEELLLVRGMTPELFSKIEPYITIYGKGPVNINTASVPVLLALGLNEPLAKKVIQFRIGTDGLTGTSDDNTITNPAEISVLIGSKVSLSESERQSLNALYVANLITAVSSYFLINSEGELPAQESKKITCIVSRDGQVWRWFER